MSVLTIEKLEVSVDHKPILRGLDLVVKTGEIHAIMGPNGSGKSTLAHALAGHPRYQVTAGQAEIDGQNLLALKPDERARHGLFLAFQHPLSVPGVSLINFLRAAYNSRRPGDDPVGLVPFVKLVREQASRLSLDQSFLERPVNDGFSGGERKKVEVLQLAVLQPLFAILDETDSGLDIDALRIVAEGVKQLVSPRLGIIVITHYQRILRFITPDRVHVLNQGRIVKSGGAELAERLEANGYESINSGEQS